MEYLLYLRGEKTPISVLGSMARRDPAAFNNISYS